MIKCEWITCVYNSENKVDDFNKKDGICKCEQDIQLKHVDNFGKCEEEKAQLEGLECQNYERKEFESDDY